MAFDRRRKILTPFGLMYPVGAWGLFPGPKLRSLGVGLQYGWTFRVITGIRLVRKGFLC